MQKIIKAYVSEKLKQKVSDRAKELDISESALIKIMVSEYFKKK